MTALDGAGRLLTSTRRTRQLALWTLAWLASVVLAGLGPQFLWNSRQPAASWIAVAFSILIGLAWIVAYTRFLQALDDLQRKIMLDALAITLGVGWVVGMGFFMAQTAGLVAIDLSTAVLGMTVLLSVAYVAAALAGKLRYR